MKTSLADSGTLFGLPFSIYIFALVALAMIFISGGQRSDCSWPPSATMSAPLA